MAFPNANDTLKALTGTNQPGNSKTSQPDEGVKNDQEAQHNEILAQALQHIQAANDTAHETERPHLEKAAKFVQNAWAEHNKPMSPGQRVTAEAKRNDAQARI